MKRQFRLVEAKLMPCTMVPNSMLAGCFVLFCVWECDAHQVLPDGRPLPTSILFNFTPEEIRAAGDLYHKLNPVTQKNMQMQRVPQAQQQPVSCWKLDDHLCIARVCVICISMHLSLKFSACFAPTTEYVGFKVRISNA